MISVSHAGATGSGHRSIAVYTVINYGVSHATEKKGGYMIPVSWLGVAIAVLQAVKDTFEEKN